MGKKSKAIVEFGDFQTPLALANEACSLLKSLGIEAESIVEPTCGLGNFITAAIAAFPNSQVVLGSDINEDYISTARRTLPKTVDLRCESFFSAKWHAAFTHLPQPILVIGNPPWVTNAQLGALRSANLPQKSNFQNRAGFDAMTGKSNFDISEWMLIRLLEWLEGKEAIVAMLCKTAVARKVLHHVWKNGINVHGSSLYRIDAAEHFGAAVDACFLVCRMNQKPSSFHCRIFGSMKSKCSSDAFGYRDNQLVAEVEAYDTWKHLQGTERYRWRSGIKHDCSGVMELRRRGTTYENGSGEEVSLEPDYLFPMLKSSDIANGKVATDRFMLVPQNSIGVETDSIETIAPRTWAYLQKHGKRLDRRCSSIYKTRPRFSVFGVGAYSFSPWKVAISGFYKTLHFRIVGPIDGKPVVLDDTANFISCRSQEEATCVAGLLNSAPAAGFFKGLVFWDAKRPLTIDVLRRLDLFRVAEELGKLDEIATIMKVVSPKPQAKEKSETIQLSLFNSPIA